jgi:hypothetical protein
MKYRREQTFKQESIDVSADPCQLNYLTWAIICERANTGLAESGCGAGHALL